MGLEYNYIMIYVLNTNLYSIWVKVREDSAKMFYLKIYFLIIYLKNYTVLNYYKLYSN